MENKGLLSVSTSTTDLLPLCLTRSLASGTLVAIPLNVDPFETLGTPPPGGRHSPVLEPLFVDAAPSLLDVLLVEFPQMVSEMV